MPDSPKRRVPTVSLLEPRVLEWLKEEAQRRERSVSWLINRLLEEAMERGPEKPTE